MKHNISSRGVLEKDNKILFIEYEDSKGIFYALPGGSQNVGEDLRSTLKREFKEEASLDIESHEVLLVREFMLSASEFEVWKNGIHQVEIIFRCSLIDDEQIAEAGLLQDQGMRGLRWIKKEEIKNLIVYPSKDLLKIIESKEMTYLFGNE